MTKPLFLLVFCALAAPALVLDAQQLAASHPVPVVQPTEVARVNGAVLKSDRLEAAVSLLLPQTSFHRTVNAAAMADLRARALRQMVDDELIYQDGRRLGVRIPVRDIDTAFAATVKRYGGRAPFRQALARARASESSVRAEVVRALVIERTRAKRVTSACQVSPVQAEQFFREHPERFEEPEQLHVFAITIGVDPSTGQAQWQQARAEADALHVQLAAGASFPDLARMHSTDPTRTQGGDMGFLHRGSLSPAFEAVTKDLALGHISPVVETLYGYHIVRITEVRPSRRMKFPEVRTRLTADLTDARCKEMSDAWITKLRSSATITTHS